MTPHTPPERRPAFSRESLREVDRRCVEEYAIPSILLMENAARGMANLARSMIEGDETRPGDAPPRVLTLVGPGNNGGDGLAAARHLHNRGITVRCLLSRHPDRYAGDAATNLHIAQRMDLDLRDCSQAGDAALDEASAGPWDLLIDALFGTGLDRPIEGHMLEFVRLARRCRGRGVPVLAADIPSGLDCDTGSPLGEAVEADATASFVGAKSGFASLEAQALVGEVVEVDIGAPRELVESLAAPCSSAACAHPTAAEAEATSHRSRAPRFPPGRGGESG